MSDCRHDPAAGPCEHDNESWCSIEGQSPWPGGGQVAFKDNFVPRGCLYLLVRYLKQCFGAEFFLCSVDCLIISLTTKIIRVAVNRKCSSPTYSPTLNCCRDIFSNSFFYVLFFRLVSRFLYKKSFNQGTWTLFISRRLIHFQNCQAVSPREWNVGYSCARDTLEMLFKFFFSINIIYHHLFLQGIFPASYIYLKPCRIDNEG